MNWKLKAAFVFVVFLFGCGSSAPPNPWTEPPRTLTVIITLNKYDYKDCVDSGGTWVIGDTKEWLGALRGCIEPTKH